MKISIITAVYNRVDTIEHAIRSVQSQSHPNLEHIIQDGGSTDGTLDVIRSFSNDSTSLISEPDSGIYDAINRGIMRASGDVIGLMHSDDFFAHSKVLERVASVMQHPNVGGVYGDLEYVSANDPTRVIRHWRAGEVSMAKLRYGWMPPHPTLYLRREVFDKWGLYDVNMRIAADYDAILRYLKVGNLNIEYISEVLVKMRVGGESNKSIGRIVKKSREDLIAIRRNKVGGVGTLILKNLSKVPQFIIKKDER
ncbi:glycosyltransferase [Sphingorhabdus sp. IMCC26285]|uniref:Glycosyltransferase n=1 Tax=Sphingorhabdus profundilacus TaxID=2509718 RepID=A0A6I4M2R8_9SPHN|nr:glycosyltransferase family 2 protein [Sphingorhabdus profundilacus]MVZ98456.1 glycosyltransferase [Sphingorhabdus profundilacus]